MQPDTKKKLEMALNIPFFFHAFISESKMNCLNFRSHDILVVIKITLSMSTKFLAQILFHSSFFVCI